MWLWTMLSLLFIRCTIVLSISLDRVVALNSKSQLDLIMKDALNS